MLLYRFWDIRKWKRDQLREGYPVGVSEYFRRYGFMFLIVQGLSISLYFAWATEKLGMDLSGLSVHVPYVPQLSWFMGFWSETFSNHVMKIFRNMTNRVLARPT